MALDIILLGLSIVLFAAAMVPLGYCFYWDHQLSKLDSGWVVGKNKVCNTTDNRYVNTYCRFAGWFSDWSGSKKTYYKLPKDGYLPDTETEDSEIKIIDWELAIVLCIVFLFLAAIALYYSFTAEAGLRDADISLVRPINPNPINTPIFDDSGKQLMIQPLVDTKMGIPKIDANNKLNVVK